MQLKNAVRRRIGLIFASSLYVFGAGMLVPACDNGSGTATTGTGGLDDKLGFLRRQLRGRVHLGGDAPKWAWVEYRLAQGGFAEGLAAAQAARAGGGFAAWKRALGQR